MYRNMNHAMTNEELLSMLENSDDDFGLSSGTDLGEGDSKTTSIQNRYIR